MRLIIDDIAKIGNVNIRLDGLTVIIGDNNTGKSTVGRVLFTMFHSLYRPQPAIDRLLGRLFFSGPEIVRLQRYVNPQSLIRKAKAGTLTVDECEGILRRMEGRRNPYLQGFQQYVGESEWSNSLLTPIYLHGMEPWSSDAERRNWAQILLNNTQRVANISNERLLGSVVTDSFCENFAYQFQPLFRGGAGNPHVRMEFRAGYVDYLWRNELPELTSQGVEIAHDACLIASPLVLNAIGLDSVRESLEPAHRTLINRLREPDETEVLFKGVVLDRLQPVMDVLNDHFDGAFIPSRGRGGLKVELPNLIDSLRVSNLSMGLKSFGIIKLMLERQILKDRDILILDEPENHLHPAWQLAYAETIVLLQRIFGLTILLTTHSPYFLEAIELYSRKYDRSFGESVLHVYQPETEVESGRVSSMQEVTGETESLYGRFAQAFRDLDMERSSQADPANERTMPNDIG